MVYIIDAKDKSIGRVASEVATLLMGKRTPQWTRRSLPDFRVEVRNITKARIDKKKLKGIHRRYHTGYPGSLREITLEKAFDKNPAQVFRRAVFGMLPANRLRKNLLKHLMISI